MIGDSIIEEVSTLNGVSYKTLHVSIRVYMNQYSLWFRVKIFLLLSTYKANLEFLSLPSVCVCVCVCVGGGGGGGGWGRGGGKGECSSPIVVSSLEL